MNDDIIKFLNIQDEDLIINKITTKNNIKTIELEKNKFPVFCPICHSRMHSKGIYQRTINHPILQDGFQLVILLNQRRWKCSNVSCKHSFNDSFGFVQANKQSTNMTPYLILFELKDLDKSAAEVAERFFVSDTYVHYLVLQYLDLERLELPEILSIDEVHLEFDEQNKYALVLMDFITGDIIDILPNRLDKTVTEYFNNIPLKERMNVKYIVCDMYNQYIRFTTRFFPNSCAIVDSFHVIQWMNNRLINYINEVKRRYVERDKKRLEEKNEINNHTYQSMKVSDEVYILNNYRWVLLKNKESIEYSDKRRYNRKLQRYMDTYAYEDAFLSLDKHFKELRDLKEKYIEFNSSTETDKKILTQQLESLISEYANQRLLPFKQFALLLDRYKKEIINSFYWINHSDGSKRRLSNGPIEGFNRLPKDYKRNSRGVSNYEYTRNRILWSNRKDAPILAIPKDKVEIYTHSNKKRGKYNKKK